MSSILVWLAILPSIVLIVRVLRLDRVESEPPGLLIKVFLLGALSCVPASILESVGDRLLLATASSELLYTIGLYLLVVPLSEEGVKYLAMRAARKSPAFNYTFDGIVYGVVASLGFATVENILYVLGLYDIGVAVMRAFLSVPLHCVCGVFMGYHYGLSYRSQALGRDGEARAQRWLAYLVPVIIHGVYDMSLSVGSDMVTLAGLALTVFVFALAIRRTMRASREDQAFWGGYRPIAPATPVAPKGYEDGGL